jgi:DNA polymerase V
MKPRVMIQKSNPDARCLPLYGAYVPAGFPSPADDFIENTLDLNTHLIRHPVATFFVRVQGDSMVEAGIHPGDILIVDRALEPCDKAVVVAAVNGDLVVKRMRRRRDGRIFLESENSLYPAIEISPEADFHVWGVVTYVIHSLS